MFRVIRVRNFGMIKSRTFTHKIIARYILVQLLDYGRRKRV